MLSLGGLLSLTEPFSFFAISRWYIYLYYCDIEWFTLEMDRDHHVVFEIAPEECISDSPVDYKGYSISYKGILPIVVGLMVI